MYCWELQFPLLLLLLPYLLLAGNVGCFLLCSWADPGKLTLTVSCSSLKTGPKKCPRNTVPFTVSLVSSTGIITKSNHASLVEIYAYDGVLFQNGILCPTCNVEKPARSKHCSKNFPILEQPNRSSFHISSPSAAAAHATSRLTQLEARTTGVDYWGPSCLLPIPGTGLLLFLLMEMTSPEGIVWGQEQTSFGGRF